MEISYYGHSCFLLRSKRATVLIDPFADYVGWRLPKLEADIVCCSHQHRDHNCLERIKGEPFIITEPGEYEIKGVSVVGLPTWHDNKKGEERGENTVFIINMAGFQICHLGDLGHVLSNKQRDEINGVEVLMIPVGGVYTLGTKRAVEVIKQIEPSYVLPMHFQTKESGKDFKDLATLDEFLKQAEVEDTTSQPKLRLDSADLPEEPKIVILERRK